MHTYTYTHRHTLTYTHTHIHTCVLDPLIRTGLRELPVAVELISCQNPNLFKDDVNMRDRWTVGQRYVKVVSDYHFQFLVTWYS